MLALLRIISGAIFVTAGTAKVFGMPAAPAGSPAPPPFDLMTQVGIGGVLELVGGLAIVLGLYTRPWSFVLAGMMAVAYFQFHHPQSFWPTVNQGIPAILYCFIFLYLMMAGAGAWSLDAILARRRARERTRGR